MLEAASIGLSLAPKVSSLSNSGKKDSGLGPSAKGHFGSPATSLLMGCPSLQGTKEANKLVRKNVKDTTNKGWFDMPAPSITPKLKKDLDVLHVMDPKRHFKRAGKSKALPEYFQVGTVIEPISEFFSSRLTKKERKATLTEELLSDQAHTSYR